MIGDNPNVALGDLDEAMGNILTKYTQGEAPEAPSDAGSKSMPSKEQLSERAKELQEAMKVDRLSRTHESQFRRWLLKSGEKDAYESLGKAFSKQREFKRKWLQLEFAAETREASMEEVSCGIKIQEKENKNKQITTTKENQSIQK